MATFRFNFLSGEKAEGGPIEGQEGTLNTATLPYEGIESSEDAVRIISGPALEFITTDENINKLEFGEYLLYRLDDEDHSSDYDLIPGAYEGGRKVM
jgi:hypothetical protein